MEEWQAHYAKRRPDEGRFVADGALSEYWEARTRVCAVLKEPDLDPSKEGPYTDLVEVFEASYEGRKLGGPAGRIALWLAGLFGRLDNFYGNDALRQKSVLEIGPRLAVINLKKTPGGAQSNDTRILSRASADRSFIRRQIELLKPHLVLSCGRPAVRGSLTWLYDLVWEHDEESACAWADHDGLLFLDLIHPSARGDYPRQQFRKLVDLRDLVREKIPGASIA